MDQQEFMAAVASAINRMEPVDRLVILGTIASVVLKDFSAGIQERWIGMLQHQLGKPAEDRPEFIN